MLGKIILAVLLLLILLVAWRAYADCKSGRGGILPKLCHLVYRVA